MEQADVAQQAEPVICNHHVRGSNTCIGSNFDDFLKQEGIYDDCVREARSRVAGYEKQGIGLGVR